MNLQYCLSLILNLVSILVFVASTILSSNALAEKPQQIPNHKENSKTVQAPPPSHNTNSPTTPDLDDTDKNPTQSLFDAINKGSLQEAQDALNRGADLHAFNVLGQTPLEMSVDLNRDRITFLLLSMRGYNNSPQSLSTISNEQSIVTVKNTKGHLYIKTKNKRTTFPLQSVQQNTDNAGIPKPEIGFLGFK